MNPADLANRLAALDWSGVSLEHQLAVSAALETIRSLAPKVESMTATEIATGTAHRLDGRAIDSSNVIALPVRKRTCWTTLCHLDGHEWARASHFGPQGAWSWIVETVAAEHGISEDQIKGAESGEDQPYDCDDLVLVDGLPVYRIRHLAE
ncbi:hypothetical protein AOQ73_05695 [Bradyrhizobium pachyrhizi]|uniref:hypothetical protein n=1 Tax=Bradyrhizobium pachyrhizi TaxID=280333 RepID=UPI00070505BD|nr:hypothetical protein [Bradyrhizobium pachyrhizi]KRQ11900.1 hypothetical protein AOQ73_05695 [Bradyrhizobium pachyrhizi]